VRISEEFLIVDASESEEDLASDLSRRLLQHNLTRRGGEWVPLTLAVVDPERRIVAGIAGGSRWGRGEIESLWVQESNRGRGIGSSLLDRAEHILAERGCGWVDLETFEFQAPDFYSRQGYRVVCDIQASPEGRARKFWMRKSFRETPPREAPLRPGLVHLMHGFIGSGKSTIAQRIGRETGAVLIAPDDWMSTIHGNDPPVADFQRNLAVLLRQLETIWIPAAKAGAPIVLDFGFWTRASRREIESRLRAESLPFRWERLNTPLEECRRRNAARRAKGEGTLVITDSIFDLLAQGFESMGEDELHPSP
jgi:predicted kinase/GNAT superfamily N-acetyltransferase